MQLRGKLHSTTSPHRQPQVKIKTWKSNNVFQKHSHRLPPEEFASTRIFSLTNNHLEALNYSKTMGKYNFGHTWPGLWPEVLRVCNKSGMHQELTVEMCTQDPIISQFTQLSSSSSRFRYSECPTRRIAASPRLPSRPADERVIDSSLSFKICPTDIETSTTVLHGIS